MKPKTNHTIKLGVFVLSGLLFLIILLYMIGRNKNIFGHTFVLKARFQQVQGLVAGNNVRYAGIEAGTVKKIYLLNDSLVEVVMAIDEQMKPYIRNNAEAWIGSDGLMGNKVINIMPANGAAPTVIEGDILPAHEMMDMDNMLRTLGKTGDDIAVIAANLAITTSRINNSQPIWDLLNDPSLPLNIRNSAANIKQATVRINAVAGNLQAMVQDSREGKGLVGALFEDTVIANNLAATIATLKQVSLQTDSLAQTLGTTVQQVQYDLQEGRGTLNALLKDSAWTQKISASLEHIEKGTASFNQNMEALKHNFLFRRYFRKQEKQQQKQTKAATAKH